eukprot:CAMPEP_0180545208 /NCGR_PEP_ID=MMETSP1036_2-20121128/69918_1 /TAXON_ID=632150 /ORGANISM="Azadinium spinosum, Strain 3D9" /LENGTH=147 /DNA_ID=CAMNT_0022560237 /DNA_START=33 /DNA_END=472 /DNA_ORIENTATION=-
MSARTRAPSQALALPRLLQCRCGMPEALEDVQLRCGGGPADRARRQAVAGADGGTSLRCPQPSVAATRGRALQWRCTRREVQKVGARVAVALVPKRFATSAALARRTAPSWRLLSPGLGPGWKLELTIIHHRGPKLKVLQEGARIFL